MIKEIADFFVKHEIERSEARAEAKLLVESLTGFTEKDFILGKSVNEEFAKLILRKAEERVATKKPIQYILGETYFMGEKFFVDENTLIPRYETELLVNRSIEIIKKNNLKRILDIGTGSGCIACVIAKNTDVRVVAVDISKEALGVAEKNAKRMDLTNIEFVQSDLFSNVEGQFDLIVSNPPYIPIDWKERLQSEVRDFEPNSALFAKDEKGLFFYEKIIRNANKYLNEKGYILFEVGVGQSKLVSEILINCGFIGVEIIKDLDSIDRVVTACNFS